MEHAKHGNPTEAWSVGKYAKRSATIHLCSNDLSQTSGTFRHKTTLIDEKGANTSIWDPDGAIRTGMGKYPAKVRIQHFDGTEEEIDASVGLNGDGLNADSPSETSLALDVDVKKIFTGPSMIPGVDPEALIGDAGRNNILRGSKAPADDQGVYKLLVDEQDVTHPAVILNKNHPELASFAGDHYLMCIPVHMFPQHLATYEKGSLDCRERLAMDYDQDDPDHWIKRARAGYRLEIYQSKNGQAGDNGAASTWDLKYNTFADVIGTYDNATLMTEHFVLIKLPNDGYIYDLFHTDTDATGTFNENRDGTATGAVTDATIFLLANPLDDAGWQNQFRFNLRKMPHVFVQSYQHFPEGQDHCNYEVTIPNTIGYPEHKRCLVQVQSLCVYAKNEFLDSNIYSMSDRVNPVYVGVLLDGVGGQNVYSTFLSNETTESKVSTTSLVGSFCLDSRGQRSWFHTDSNPPLSYGFDNQRSILDDGVLINSPFGKQLRVRLINLSNKKTLNTNTGEHDETGHAPSDDINENPTHLTLRILFLDDDDLPDR